MLTIKYIKSWLLLLSSFCIGVLHAQEAQKLTKAQQQSIQFYEKALPFLQDGYTEQGIFLLKKSLLADSTNVQACLSLAGAYGELKKYQWSVDFYKKAFKMEQEFTKNFLLPYAINLAGLGLFTEALQAIDSFLTVPKLTNASLKAAFYRKKCFEFAVAQQARKELLYQIAPINLGDSVNTSFLEYFPSLALNDSLLVFTRRGSENGGEYFYQSKLLDQHTFSKATLIPGSLNAEPRKGAITISADGEWLIFAGNLPGKTYGSFDLFIAYNTPQGWSEPENLGANINSENWESGPALSPDNKILYFTSDRPGGLGGSDLYMSIRQANGKWGAAINMGSVFNSAGNEQAPFVHPDNQTLYYTSNGLLGYGGDDLFMARKSANGQWQQPENLGYPINTIENEGSMIVSADGKTAYYASDRGDTRGKLDIYSFELPAHLRPIQTLFVKGRVYDAQTTKGVPCAIDLIDNQTGVALMQLQTDETGKYFITLPVKGSYTFSVHRKGYFFYNRLYEFYNAQADSTYAYDIPLQPLTQQASAIINNVLFNTNAASLLPQAQVALDKIFELLKENPTLKAQINGHTDNVGKETDNVVLSQQRAKAVVDYLVAKGIAANRLTYKGFGAQKPIATNDSEKGRSQNRRTELVILEL